MAFYEENPQGIARADLVVAIPSSNESESIGNAAEQAAKGLREYFGTKKSVIINCDNNSQDGTKEAFFSAPGDIPKIYLSTAPGVHGKGNNLRNLYEKVRELQPQTVVILESDIKNIAPHWIRNLAEPVFRGAGYVCALYVRHKYEATLTSSILYPFMRCLYGRRVRQPNIGDFGFRGDLAEAFLSSPVWTNAVQHFGIDIWMTTIALNARIPVCQAYMGAPKIHRAKDAFAHLTVLFHEVVSTMFDLMGVYSKFWHQVKWSKPTALFGTDGHDVSTPLPYDVNVSRLHSSFLEGFDRYGSIWNEIYEQSVCHKLQEIRGMGLQHFSFPTQHWASILFDSANAYHRTEPSRRALILDALLPLYMGKVLSFVKKTERMSLQQAEEYIETECAIFEENKPYIVKIWE